MSHCHSQLKQEFENDIELTYGEVQKAHSIDMVNNPPHYNQNGIKTIEYMKAYSTKEEFCGHLRLTALKYLSRTGKKDNMFQDLEKAKWYLDKLIEEQKC